METKSLTDAPARLLTPAALEALQMSGISPAADVTVTQLAEAAADMACARCPEAAEYGAALTALADWVQGS